VGPDAGEIEVTVGEAYMKVAAAEVCPPTRTTTLAGPEPCAGVVHAMVLCELLVTGHATPSMVTTGPGGEEGPKLSPVMVNIVPPAVGPVSGFMVLIEGGL
jgi:hypothetical protein